MNLYDLVNHIGLGLVHTIHYATLQFCLCLILFANWGGVSKSAMTLWPLLIVNTAFILFYHLVCFNRDDRLSAHGLSLFYCVRIIGCPEPHDTSVDQFNLESFCFTPSHHFRS